MNKTRLSIAAVVIILAGCENETGPGMDIHDTKYASVDEQGRVMQDPAITGACVLDQFTGLSWEVKTDQPGLHHRDYTYSWHDPHESNDGELDYRGSPDQGDCEYSRCDTTAFVAAVNEAKLCGYQDWRLPTRDELASISDLRKAGNPPTANMQYFPNMHSGEYWSGNDYAFQWNAAWLWSYEHGHDRVEWKATPRYLRLVRGDPRHVARVKD